MDQEIQTVQTDSGVLSVQSGRVYVDDVQLEDHRKSHLELRADVYTVPEEYRASGFFVGFSAFNEPKEVPGNSQFKFVGSIKVPADEGEALAEAKRHKESQLNELYEEITGLLRSNYPESERESWSIQTQESMLFLEDENNETPWLDNAAAARGVDRAEMARLIEPMFRLYRVAHGKLTGTRQRLRDEIQAHEDLEALQGFDFRTPLEEVQNEIYLGMTGKTA